MPSEVIASSEATQDFAGRRNLSAQETYGARLKRDTIGDKTLLYVELYWKGLMALDHDPATGKVKLGEGERVIWQYAWRSRSMLERAYATNHFMVYYRDALDRLYDEAEKAGHKIPD